MASTYVNDLRLNEMATGDESGNWGVVTNLNLELIGEALGYGTEGITTNADTHTTTVADGATDPGRAMYIEYTGTLDSACTITIAPNTLNRMHFIENGTSGSQNIIISQGSGANITIPPGDTKAVYLDGAGSGAAVVDAFASLSVVDLKVQDDLTVTDDATIGGTLGVTGVLTATSLDISGDIDVDGTSNLDIVDIDGAVDMASTLQVDGAITSSAGATITVADNSENLVLKSTDADANVGPQLTLWRASGSPADNDAIGQISFNANDDGANVTNFATIAGFIDDASDGSEDGIIHINSMVAGTLVNRMSVLPAATVFNEGSVDVDFRVESNGNANMLFVNAGTDRIGIGVNDPTDALEIRGNLGISASGTGSKVIAFRSGDTQSAFIEKSGDNMDIFNADAGRLGFATNNAEKMRIDSNGDVGIGVTNPTNKLAVTDSASSNNKIIGMFTGEGVNTGAADGGQYIAVTRGGAISQVNSVSGGLILGSNSATGSTANIVGVYQFTSGRDIRFLVSSDNTSDPSLRMLLKGSGQFCVGLTSPGDGGYISVVSNGGEGLFNGVDSTNAYRRYYHTVADGIHRFKGSANTATLSNAGAWGDASDIAYKKDIVDTVYGLDTVKQFQPRDFVLKADETNQTGFIAQEMETVCPQFVVGEEGTKTINYGQITSVLTKAIQELETRVATLEG